MYIEHVKEEFGAFYVDHFGVAASAFATVLPEGKKAVLKGIVNSPVNRKLVSKMWQSFKEKTPGAEAYEMRYRYRGPRDASIRGRYNAQSYALQSEGKTFSVYLYEKNVPYVPTISVPDPNTDYEDGFEDGLTAADKLIVELLMTETDSNRVAGIHMAMKAVRGLLK